MQDDMKKTLSKVRLEHAYECLKSARILLETISNYLSNH